MSINNKLITFAQQNLVLARREGERDKINASLNQLEKVLKNKLGDQVESFLRFGSYTRNTILPRKFDVKSDVDLMVVFDTSTQEFKPGTYRSRILSVLQAAYPNSISKKSFPAIKLELNHIMFDLVPAVKQNSIWRGETIYIPDSGDGWRETNPNDVNDRLSNRNQHYGNNTVRNIIRLMKHWNSSRNYPFESYLMEKDIIELNFSRDDTYKGFLYALEKLATGVSNTSQALEFINEYQKREDYKNELAWVSRLLPGLN
jgi:predicted nucleotidyltransferase